MGKLEDKFITDLKNLKRNNSTTLFRAIISPISSSSDNSEIYEVEIFRNSELQYKLQWTEYGSKGEKIASIMDIKSKIKPKINAKLQIELENRNTYLTSGIRSYMMTPELVLDTLKILGKNGIIIDYH